MLTFVKPLSAGIFSFLLLTITSSTLADTLPTAGNITAGNGTITQTISDMTINQSSQNMVIDWQGFSIGENSSVTFDQPSASSTALNRVIGSEISHIQGILKANGRVFLINPSGVLFHDTASVNVGDLVVSTLNMSNEDFMGGNYDFNGNSPGQIINRGDISAADGGFVVFIAAKIENTGTITANSGGVLLGAGSKVILDLGGPVKLKVEKAAIDALIEQGGAIRADGGLVYISAKAAGDLTYTVINHTGITRARTLSSGENGEIYLMGDMENDRIAVGGTLDASAPDGGDGGFIETSASDLKVEEGTMVRAGHWLLDPTDITIDAPMATTLEGQLAEGAASVVTVDGGADAGDINVEAKITWSANTLTLTAHNDININAVMTATGAAGLVMNTGASGAVKVGFNDGEATGFKGKVNLESTTTLKINGEDYIIINDLGVAGDATSGTAQTLQGMARIANLSGHYALGSDIDASDTSTWNSGEGFAPIGDNSTFNDTTRFRGTFNGLGHTITDLKINRPAANNIGLFGYTSGAEIRNVGIRRGIITGRNYVGGLAGYLSNHTVVSVCYGNAEVAGEGEKYVGGLAGFATGSEICNSFSSGSVSGDGNYVGGLVGMLRSSSVVGSSFSSTEVNGVNNVGGLVGNCHDSSTITDSCAEGTVAGSGEKAGGLVGYLSGSSTITNSWSSGLVTVGSVSTAGGLTGENDSTSTVTSSYWDIETSGISISAGGTGVTTAQMKTMTTFTDWDISAEKDAFSTWYIDPGNDYPRLRAFLSFPETPAGGDSGSSPSTLAPLPEPVLAAIGNSAFQQDPLSGPRFYQPRSNNWPLVGRQGINLPGDIEWHQNWPREGGLDNRDLEGQDPNEE